MGRLVVRAAIAAALVTVLAACGHRAAPPAPGVVRAAVVRVYFLGRGSVRPVARRVRSRPLARAAFAQLLAGPNARERGAGLTTALAPRPAPTLDVANGIATVPLSPTSPAARAQIVYTLTQFPGVRAVVLGSGRPLRRMDFERQTPPLLVESPLPGTRVTSPLRIRGTANVFEATFQADVVDGNGKVLAHKTVTATSGSGQRGTFDATLVFARAGRGTLVVYENSAADGSRIHQVEIPLELRP
jgi:germination protein M